MKDVFKSAAVPAAEASRTSWGIHWFANCTHGDAPTCFTKFDLRSSENKISAEKYAALGISIFTSTAEVVSYSAIIPCDVCEPVDEEVQVEIRPWYTISADYSATPESAYSYNDFNYQSDRIICDLSLIHI